MPVISKILSGEYRDSLFLMRISEELSKKPEIKNAVVVMGTPSNLEILKELGMLTNEITTASSDDLVISLETYDNSFSEKIISETISLLSKTERKETRKAYYSLSDALDKNPSANIVVISISGEYVYPVAEEAINAGRNVFCFSSNLSVEEEIQLKKNAISKKVLFMGPDCGTAIIDGVGLGFANSVRRGNIGVVSASGSGLQEFSVLINEGGGGISQAIGVGSRDLLTGVDGLMTLESLKRLAFSGEIKVLVLIAKRSSSDVVEKIAKIASDTGMPVIIYLADQSSTIKFPHYEGLFLTQTITEAADLALSSIGLNNSSINKDIGKYQSQWIEKNVGKLTAEQKWIRGLYAGGSLRGEAKNIIERIVGNVLSEEDINKNEKQNIKGNLLIDLGAEEFTQGRAHPFIDPRIRSLYLKKAMEDPEVACILIDIVLGWGSHYDPGGIFIENLQQIRKQESHEIREIPIIASVCGSSDDPQSLSEQRKKLLSEDIYLGRSSSEAAYVAIKLLIRNQVRREQNINLRSRSNLLFETEPEIVNVGLEHFAKAIESQGIKVIRVNWQPPVKRSKEIDKLLDSLL